MFFKHFRTNIYIIAVHCYGCDEEVQDENLAEHLANFGINIAKLQKTEKTITEMVYSLLKKQLILKHRIFN